MVGAALWLSALSSLGFAAIIVTGFVWPRLGWGSFWPADDKTRGQTVRRLFRIGVGSLLVLSVVMLRAAPVTPPYATQGAIMFGIGFGMALRITRALGWQVAFGAAGELVTTGWFARSRNPIYVATWLGLIGWALLVPEIEVLVPLTLWAVLYALAAFWEEPWLRRTYGADYDAYAAQVPRFF